MYPQPRPGTRYEKSLKRRFEKADQVFREIYLRKARLDKKGLRTYTAVEFRQDLYATAFGHGLCAEALMVYFKVLHRHEILRVSAPLAQRSYTASEARTSNLSDDQYKAILKAAQRRLRPALLARAIDYLLRF